ncbi:hypothetical protein HMPREF0063_10975 [Aeromicrobium marinum DSM 15272]|uniref:Uncharacterized protein n=2 Tax=Aeromicrobium marinum TaxID=219314 RepID=E2SAI5_9ACTN|nr:hypothetical protein HMPREF0063_10975 [Aeromicrobium marinum DSM 15272]
MLWPQDPNFVNATERRVWTALRDQLGPRDLLIANQAFTTRARDHELDIAVVLDGSGVVVVEVKGGSVWCEDGHWWQAHRGGDHRIDPVGQAKTVKHVLRDWVEESSAWMGRRRIRWAHAVAFPHSEFDRRFGTPDCSRDMVIDRDDLGEIATRLRNLLAVQDSGYRVPDPSDALAIHDALAGRFTPKRLTSATIEEAVAHRDELVERLSAEQANILDATQALTRVEVRGGAGSGKTWLAVEQARRLAASGLRVALLSYTRGLSEWMRRRVSTFVPTDRPAYVGTFHDIGAMWGHQVDRDNNDQHFWEVELPATLLDLAGRQPVAELFDAIVIDEAQDFADDWWPVVLEALKYEDDRLYVYSDEGQRIFQRFGKLPGGLVPLVLDRNLRNTKEIGEAFEPMVPNRMRLGTESGPAVRFVPCAREDASSIADDEVERLLDEGWQPSDLALLTTQSRHQEQLNRLEQGQDAYWASFWDTDQVFYGTVLGFKGLERPAVVVAVNDTADLARAKERLYVGLSRARDHLVVCGDPEMIERFGGPEVLRRLQGE